MTTLRTPNPIATVIFTAAGPSTLVLKTALRLALDQYQTRTVLSLLAQPSKRIARFE
ncbi:hypothetical protein QT972_28960 [Microcoleus sp. herbarium7]